MVGNPHLGITPTLPRIRPQLCLFGDQVKQRVVLLLASEFKNCNLRPSTDADRERDGADAPVDVKLSVALLEPPADIRCQQARSRKATMLEFDGHLPAVRAWRNWQTGALAGKEKLAGHGRGHLGSRDP